MRLTKSLGSILLAIWLILWGLMVVVTGFALPPDCHGGARDRSRGLNPAGSISSSFSFPTVLMSDGNWQSALCDLQDARLVRHRYRVAQAIGETHMDANQDIVQGKWPELKGQVKQQWGKLTDDDVQRLSGKTEELTGVLQQRYGYGKVQAEMEINKWVSAHDQAPTKV